MSGRVVVIRDTYDWKDWMTEFWIPTSDLAITKSDKGQQWFLTNVIRDKDDFRHSGERDVRRARDIRIVPSEENSTRQRFLYHFTVQRSHATFSRKTNTTYSSFCQQHHSAYTFAVTRSPFHLDFFRWYCRSDMQADIQRTAKKNFLPVPPVHHVDTWILLRVQQRLCVQQRFLLKRRKSNLYAHTSSRSRARETLHSSPSCYVSDTGKKICRRLSVVSGRLHRYKIQDVRTTLIRNLWHEVGSNDWSRISNTRTNVIDVRSNLSERVILYGHEHVITPQDERKS